jgi:integrase
VEDDLVDATLTYLGPKVAAMVRFQRLTGCRPGEVIRIRPRDVDRSGDVWVIRLGEHKTAHHGKDRTIYVGPKAQAVLAKYLLKPEDRYCFESVGHRCYSVDSYRRAIQRVCERHDLPKWAPNQLRHTAGTAVREQCGLETAQAVLGHANMQTTQIYAERLDAAAREAARRLG